MQKIRLKDVAARAGVAVNTASTILNRRPNSWASKETEERVFKAAGEEINTTVAPDQESTGDEKPLVSDPAPEADPEAEEETTAPPE